LRGNNDLLCLLTATTGCAQQKSHNRDKNKHSWANCHGGIYSES
jgi:hypothetical protein